MLLDPEDEIIWPWVKALCNACKDPYWFQNARVMDVSLSRIDCGCGTKAFPKSVYAYELLEDKNEPIN